MRLHAAVAPCSTSLDAIFSEAGSRARSDTRDGLRNASIWAPPCGTHLDYVRGTMLPRTTLSLAAVLAASCPAVACAPPAVVEDVDGQGAAISGSTDTEGDSPLVYILLRRD